MPTLAEMRSSPPTSRPEEPMTVCFRHDLVAEVKSILTQMQEYGSEPPPEPEPVEQPDVDDGRPVRVVPRAGDKPEVGPSAAQVAYDAWMAVEEQRMTALEARLAEVNAEMAPHSGELRLRAIDDGAWDTWTDEHPARPKGQPGHDRDTLITSGYCNSDALIANLGKFAHSWDGEPLADGDWLNIFGGMCGADKKEAAKLVVTMQVVSGSADFLRWRNASSAIQSRLGALNSASTSESAPVSSTVGLPAAPTAT